MRGGDGDRDSSMVSGDNDAKKSSVRRCAGGGGGEKAAPQQLHFSVLLSSPFLLVWQAVNTAMTGGVLSEWRVVVVLTVQLVAGIR